MNDEISTSALATTRLLPHVTEVNRAFWEGGRDGLLHLEFCPSCERFANPPQGRCERCEGPVEFRAASGRGRIFTFTINHQPYNPAVPVPYVVALVELEEQEGLRVFTNIVNVSPEDVAIDMEVSVVFEDHDPLFIPVFVPA